MKAIPILVMLALVIGAYAPAAFATDFEITFNVAKPDITVIAYKGPAGSYQWEGTAMFTLTGTGSAVGEITASNTGVFESYTNYVNQPMVVGGYTASGGNFQSVFSAYSYELDGPAYFGHGDWSVHSITATGVSSMTVSGDATAAAGGDPLGGFVEGGQGFSGVLDSITMLGSKVDSTKQGINPLTWDPTKFTGATFSATASGLGISVSGSTDAGTYPTGSETHPWAVLAKQGLGFGISTTGTSLSGLLTTTYPYTDVLVQPSAIIGETSTPLVGWTGVPGFIFP